MNDLKKGDTVKFRSMGHWLKGKLQSDLTRQSSKIGYYVTEHGDVFKATKARPGRYFVFKAYVMSVPRADVALADAFITQFTDASRRELRLVLDDPGYIIYEMPHEADDAATLQYYDALAPDIEQRLAESFGSCDVEVVNNRHYKTWQFDLPLGRRVIITFVHGSFMPVVPTITLLEL